jgi:Na+/H+-dicarboxylate symporter
VKIVILQNSHLTNYLAQDSFGTACNVTGDGEIALMVNRLSGHKLAPQE